MSFAGLRVLSLESRRAPEIATLIRNYQGDPFVAPSMRETPLEENEEAFQFAERLFRGEFDMMILLTGVGTKSLDKVLTSRFPANAFREALRKLTVVARGSKPAVVLREFQVPIAIMVPEPNTWKEVLEATRDRTEKKIAVQEYGKSNPELLDGLRARGAEVTPVRVYQWDLPFDLEPLREAVRRLVAGQIDVVMFTTSIQIQHLFRIASEAGLERKIADALKKVVVASIGPTTSETLQEFNIHVDVAPSHPKMGFLVKETSEQAEAILRDKRELAS